jgi:hypothetical protein
MNIIKEQNSLSLQQPIDRLIATKHYFVFIDCSANRSIFLVFSSIDYVLYIYINMAEKNNQRSNTTKMATTLMAYAQLEIDNSPTCIPR